MEKISRHRLILGGNIRKLRKEQKMTILALANMIDSDVGNISRVERGLQGCSDELLQKLATALRTTPAELLRDSSFENVEPIPLGTRRIPVINSIQAGQLTTVVDAFPPGMALEWIETDVDVSPGTFALVIGGKSMEPEFAEGDKVIIDPEIRPQPGDFVAAKNGEEEATFKKYRLRGLTESGAEIFELVPLNPDFPTIRSDQMELRIIGVMVEHRRYRRRR
ncbi:LexA family protein [Burkholderia ubonensis]|uniref:LexA family protein n=1 Tax=Burkholderia ubonensis TaxID=101571 RepID=UPI0009B36F8D|nr:S24 family peptidase [Burkholderia ubonensis]